jgi:hypothetical protein
MVALEWLADAARGRRPPVVELTVAPGRRLEYRYIEKGEDGTYVLHHRPDWAADAVKEYSLDAMEVYMRRVSRGEPAC